MTQPVTDWDLYRKCSVICRAETGQPCFTASSRIVNGQPDRIRTTLERPHPSRKMRVRRR